MRSVTASKKASRGAVLSWALYDAGNSLWPMTITLYVALWFIDDHNVPEVIYGTVYSSSLVVVALVSPVLGAVSDRYGRRLPFLMLFTSVAVVAMSLITVGENMTLSLFFFALAMFTFQSALLYYDALLDAVADEESRGRISGLGVAMGYTGTVVGVLLLAPFVQLGGRGWAFLPTGLLYLFLALPCFLFVKERFREPWRWSYIIEGYRRVFQTLREARRHANVFRYLVARLFYIDAITTVTVFVATYTVKVLDFTDEMNRALFLVGAIFAVVGAFVYGRVVDWIGPKRTLVLVLAQWTVVIIAGASTVYPASFWAIGVLSGLSLGALWTADRVLLIRLSPPENLGQFFGLYNLMGKVSAVMGPFIVGATISALEDQVGINAYRIALGIVLVLLVTGILVLLGVKNR